MSLSLYVCLFVGVVKLFFPHSIHIDTGELINQEVKIQALLI